MAEPAFIGLDGGSIAFAVSADGSVVVGEFADQAFRWTMENGLVNLGDLAGGASSSFALDVSADGSVVVGRGSSASGTEAFRWTAVDGMVGLGDLSDGEFESTAYGVSHDGNVVVGSGASASGTEAFRWTQAEGIVGLGDLPGGEFLSSAYAVSADGSVVVGSGTNELTRDAVRWTAEEGLVGLGAPPGTGPSFLNYADSVSADGTIIVGGKFNEPVGMALAEAFRWTADEGFIGLGAGDDVASLVATGVSADGSVIVGTGVPTTIGVGLGLRAFIWDEANGPRDLNDVLVNEFGLDLGGWTLNQVNDISADGRTIVGLGENPQGVDSGWIVVVPEPSSFLLAGFAVVGFGLIARRKKTSR